jgi:hypothetical protein
VGATVLEFGPDEPFPVTSASKNLSYWSIGDGDDTMVTLWNPADEAQELMFTLFFSGGHYRFPIHLGPRATYAFNVSEIIHNQIPDDEGNLIPATVHEGSAEISGALGENEHILVAMDSGVYNIRKATCNFFCETCNGFVSTLTTIDPAPWATAVGGTSQLTFTMTYNTGSKYNLNSQSTWSSSNTGVSSVSTGLVRGVSAGSATVTAQSNVTEPVSVGTLCQRNALPPCPTQAPGGSGGGTVGVPSSELTSFESLYQITAGQFLMTLLPSTYSYDGNSVTESSPVIGSNQCWWSGSGMVQYPVVAGSTWIVDTGDAGHNQYGLDTVGFGNGVVNLIQTQGPAHDVEFPCDIYIYQSMNYDGIDLYVTNLLSQKIGSNTVTVCRAGECSSSINY